MAFMKSTLITTQAPIAYDDSLIDTIKAFFAKRKAIAQLQALSERELADIGLCRADIKAAVKGDLYR